MEGFKIGNTFIDSSEEARISFEATTIMLAPAVFKIICRDIIGNNKDQLIEKHIGLNVS